ncbi:similar to Saccharomyces cerevisiae YDL175C AIR2 Zinc knuckle protein, involved in nuclear RNA processing and degredation as a component of the TRAMP complex [Maudiozyma saulgeensis]|uniref:Similar to Saccharomyces cerevisiae YDL175C AIR2 Zinc knuckle protein, involved in nuclear RNA processing and degredation as a component of the TRAMP complex n=1 Tax=Maudiozyma saulgeensis TaxID=1789683 RepID=A0A1X7QY10_9SACH|nr:similar to Saccharomyces cerevisiae YDL175C AIR2 Zinc knuckle protein, involved in nuclear RNA processing and degredation as a component of the TRAMP complex [Kazachstania saulgeensis]
MSSLSEVETQDTLPFVVDPTPQKQTIEPPKIVAPSIDQVDEDPEVLRSLRGQGRYFGVSDSNGLSSAVKEAEPKCNNCSQRGHLKKNCPHVICTYCGSMDDHYSQHCPKAIKCSNCNEKGHYRSQCPQKWKKVYCTLCDSNKHSRDRCPSIWRVYLLRDDISQERKTPKGLSLDMEKVFCYNCGLTGHFGDDCSERRSSRVPNEDGSAFSGENLSYVLKDEYFDNVDSQYVNSRRYDHGGYNSRGGREAYFSNNNNNNNGGFDYNDYEYDDSKYDNDYQNTNKSKKRFRNDRQNHNSNNNGYIQPTRRGNTLQPMRDQYKNNSNSGGNRQQQHPLTFPRSNYGGSNAITQGLDNARYANSSSSYNNNNNSYNQNTKRYNQYKPFRSGTIKK